MRLPRFSLMLFAVMFAMMVVGAVTACSTTPDSASTLELIAPASPLPEPAETILRRIGSLENVQIADNSCGLFLWSRIGTKRLLVTVLQNDLPGALIQLDGETRRLRQTLTEGRAYYGLFERTHLEGAALQAALTLHHDAIKPLAQGAIIRRASLRLTDEQGYTLAMPLVGLIACQVEQIDQEN